MTKVAFIEWEDASGSDAVIDIKQAHRLKPTLNKSAGIVIFEDESRITISQDLWETFEGGLHARELESIPRSHIQNIRTWEVSDGKKSARR